MSIPITRLFLWISAVLFLSPTAPSWAQSAADCLVCHSDPSLTTEKNGKQVSLFVDETIFKKSAHGKLVCVACHTGFDADNVPHKENISPVRCTTCHKNAALKHPFHPAIAKASGMNGSPAVSCKSCHGTHEVVSPKVPGSKFHRSNLAAACGMCHPSQREKYSRSAHGKAAASGIGGAPQCITCHSNDITNVRPGRDSTQLKVSQEKMCLSCHLDNPDVRARTSPTAGFIAAYERSVHGAQLLKGNGKAANCIDCHGSHEIEKGIEPASRVNKHNIPQTCGRCHTEILREFRESIHGSALARGVVDAPACTNCHGEHNIFSPSDPRSPVAPSNVSGQVCSPCHSSLRLSEKYGLAADRFKTFSASYHGLALRAGSLEVANCASCHGAHNIRPSNDPRSTVNKANLAVTCGKCHPGANERFAIGSVHVTMKADGDPVLYWIATIYIILIVSLVGGMLLHNSVDFVKKARRRFRIRRGEITEEYVGHSLYVRMTVDERLQHGALLLSFMTLVITGFMLRYPEAWWVEWIRSVDSSVFELRGLVHRSAAVVMIGASLYHLYYLLFTDRGRRLMRDLIPVRRDIYDAIAVMKYNLGYLKEKPRFGRFSYIEKSEYWALVWGTLVMGATGFVMWFDNTFIGLFTKLGYDIARTVHFYEAWLATLAIIVWHFYYVIFNPDIYPMNLAWLKGYLTESEMEEEHPLELEQIRREGREGEFISISAKEDGSFDTRKGEP